MAATNGIMQMVQDGELVDTSASGNSLSSKNKKNSSLDKEAFLQLLVAQMKYQDPLEPTSNTEYISQLATFSSLEEMQNLNTTMTTVKAMDLVGKQVVLNVTSDVTGMSTVVSGMVEYVTIENGKTYLVVNGSPYSIDDLESVIDDKYLDAIALAESFKEAVKQLPDLKNVTLKDKEKIEKVREVVNSMNGYQQSFLDEDSLNKLKDLIKKIEELEAADKENGGGAGKPETEKPETEKPETEKPETEKPEPEKPETEKPGTESTDNTVVPDNGTSGGEAK